MTAFQLKQETSSIGLTWCNSFYFVALRPPSACWDCRIDPKYESPPGPIPLPKNSDKDMKCIFSITIIIIRLQTFSGLVLCLHRNIMVFCDHSMQMWEIICYTFRSALNLEESTPCRMKIEIIRPKQGNRKIKIHQQKNHSNKNITRGGDNNCIAVLLEQLLKQHLQPQSTFCPETQNQNCNNEWRCQTWFFLISSDIFFREAVWNPVSEHRYIYDQ